MSCIGVFGLGNMGESGMSMVCVLGCVVFLLGVESMIWCPSMVGSGYCSVTGVAVSGSPWSLCCRVVVLGVVGVVCDCAESVRWWVVVAFAGGCVVVVNVVLFLSGVDRSLGKAAGAAHSSLSVVVVLSGVVSPLGTSAGVSHNSLVFVLSGVDNPLGSSAGAAHSSLALVSVVVVADTVESNRSVATCWSW